VEGDDSSDQRYIARRTRSGTGRLLSFAVTPSAPRKEVTIDERAFYDVLRWSAPTSP